MLVLRDIGFLKVNRFNQIIRTLPGLTPRVLTMRLRELEEEGFIKQIEVRGTPRIIRWGLTPKGEDTLPILMGLIGFGSKWYPDVVFADKHPRTLEELFPKRVKFDPVIR
jgi:DNA-binding HxlR family transcriptional regulator